jgi:diaminopimelate epimerase
LVKSVDGAIDVIEALKIRFRKHDLKPYTSKSELTISGYLVFTGEPHLVVLADSGLSIPDLGPMLFVEGIKMPAPNGQIEKRVGFGSWLINHIGLFVNKTYRDMFPAGISINFVRVDQDQHLAEYRCFERGIDKETLACGTGALAVSYVVHQLGLLKENPICLWPHRCRWHEAQAQIIVEHKDGWLLSGHPAYLYDGQFRYQSAQAFEVPNPKIACLESDPALQAQDTSALPSAAS